MFLPVIGLCVLLLVICVTVTLFKIRKNYHFKDASHFEVVTVERDTNLIPFIVDFIGKIVLPIAILTVESYTWCAILLFVFVIFGFYSIRVDMNFLYALIFNVYKVKTEDGIVYTVFSFEDIEYITSGKYLEVGNGVLLYR